MRRLHPGRTRKRQGADAAVRTRMRDESPRERQRAAADNRAEKAGGSGRAQRLEVLPRFHVGPELGLSPGLACALPDGAARHVQVLRMQPGAVVHLFDGAGRTWEATVTEMGRKVVTVEVGAAVANDRELPVEVTLAMGMPANDRMDALVEKAAELGVGVIQPLVCERSVLRLDGERAAKKVAHWQAVAVAACEQSGRAVVPTVRPVSSLASWLSSEGGAALGGVHRGVLSLREAVSVQDWLDQADAVTNEPASQGGVQACADKGQRRRFVFLSGPEGGLSPQEESAALGAGWSAVSLGRRVLRADTAPLAVLSVIGARYER